MALPQGLQFGFIPAVLKVQVSPRVNGLPLCAVLVGEQTERTQPRWAMSAKFSIALPAATLCHPCRIDPACLMRRVEVIDMRADAPPLHEPTNT